MAAAPVVGWWGPVAVLATTAGPVAVHDNGRAESSKLYCLGRSGKAAAGIPTDKDSLVVAVVKDKDREAPTHCLPELDTRPPGPQAEGSVQLPRADSW
jgi:hypothetical protein